MSMSQQQTKPHESIIADVENGDEISREPSSLGFETRSIELDAIERRENHEDDGQEPQQTTIAVLRRRVWKRVPTPIATRGTTLFQWIKGPQPSRVYTIHPLLPRLQTFPVRNLSRMPKAGRFGIVLVIFALWVALFVVILSRYGLPNNIGGYGAPVRLACISRLWSDSQSCGLDGGNCLPFDDRSFAFSCPADCSQAKVLNPRTVGDETINYRSLVVGGTSETSEAGQAVYRGDSFICGAAIHAGVFKDSKGGCGVLSLTGEKSSYGSIFRNGILSIGFNSSFPLSFDFDKDAHVAADAAKCGDPQWDALIVSVIFSSIISLITTSPVIFFASVFIIAYFQIALASDAPAFDSYASAVSTALGSFLPAAFIAVFIYHFFVRRSLHKMTAQIEKTVLWVGGLWVGSLSNYTFEKIPLQRLTSHDLHQQPGAVIALIIIVIVLVVVGLYQAWCFRNEGRLPRFLALYAILGIGLGILASIPGLDLRIHHYILALLLLPGTSLQTRPSLLYQGILVGLFINGLARWGFAAILQTAASLQGDALLGSGLPTILEPVINSNNITFTWGDLLQGWDGISVLVNDVERYQGFNDSSNASFTWTRQALDHPEYFRFGFVDYESFGGLYFSDYTEAGTWWPNGSWSGILPGNTQ